MSAARTRYLELLGIILIGTFHVLTEVISGSLVISRIYNAAAAILLIGYLIARIMRTPTVLHEWGLRLNNLWPAVRAQLPFVTVAALAMCAWAWSQGVRSIPPTFWIAFAVYVLWGTAQQFALQNLLARNLRPLVPSVLLWAFLSALIFSLSHIPRYDIVALALLAGFFLTLGYRRQENIWVAGAAHGLLGAMAFYALLGKDPGALIVKTIMSMLGEST